MKLKKLSRRLIITTRCEVMVGLIFCIIVLIILGNRETTKTENLIKHAHQQLDNTDFDREQELFRYFMAYHKRLDGTPIPKDFHYRSIWNEVDKQLRLEGKRLSPTTCDLSKIKFDKDGYIIPYSEYKK